MLYGDGGNDRLDGGAGADTMAAARATTPTSSTMPADVITENVDEGSDTVESSVTLHARGDNVENLVLTGTKAINGTGNALDNLVRGNSANNTLNGGGGNDILEGGAGNDTLTDATGTALFNGGAGADVLTGGAGSQICLGGQGNDTLTTGAGDDLLLFNRGDGQDTLATGDSGQDTLSLGGGVRYADLSFTKSSNDLVLKMGCERPDHVQGLVRGHADPQRRQPADDRRRDVRFRRRRQRPAARRQGRVASTSAGWSARSTRRVPPNPVAHQLGADRRAGELPAGRLRQRRARGRPRVPVSASNGTLAGIGVMPALESWTTRRSVLGAGADAARRAAGRVAALVVKLGPAARRRAASPRRQPGDAVRGMAR